MAYFEGNHLFVGLRTVEEAGQLKDVELIELSVECSSGNRATRLPSLFTDGGRRLFR